MASFYQKNCLPLTFVLFNYCSLDSHLSILKHITLRITFLLDLLETYDFYGLCFYELDLNLSAISNKIK